MSEAAATTTTQTTTTATPPATTTEGSAATTTQATSTDWTASFNDDNKGYVQNKGFKDPSSLLDSYRNLEKLVGVPADRVLKLPEKDDAPEWAGIFERLGTPKDPKEYKIDLPKEGGDPVLAANAREMFKAAGLTTKQASTLVEKWNAAQTAGKAAQVEQYNTQVNQDMTALKKEWGAAYDQEIGLAKLAANGLGFDQTKISQLEQVMGFAGVMKMFSGLGSKMGEDSFVRPAGGNGFGAMTPAQAKDRINALRADTDWVKRYTAGGASEKQEFQRLNEMAYQ